MVRGLKKKLLIGLLSAAVVGTSLAPSVPLVGSFAQEVKATDSELPEGMYKYTKIEVKKEHTTTPATYKWKFPEFAVYTAANDNAELNKETYQKPTAANQKIPGTLYKKVGSEFVELQEDISSEEDQPASETYSWDHKFKENTYYKLETNGNYSLMTGFQEANAEAPEKFDVYTKEKDNTKSSVTVEEATDTASTVKPKSIGSTNGSTATIDKNKATKITVDVEASAGKVIKSVVAKVINAATNKQIGSDITATKVDGTENTYELLVTATEDTVKVLISTEEEDLLITPKLSSTLSSKVGTAELTSTSAVKPGKKIELKVTLAEGATKANVTVKAAGKVIGGSDPDDGVVTYSIDTTDVKDEELEIEVSGRLDNDGLEKEKTDKGSTATVVNAGDAAADANDVLDVAKSDQDGKYVNAKLNISTSDDTETKALKSEVALAEKSGLKLAGYISVDFFRTVSDTPGAAVTITGAENQKVTKLGAPLAVKYFLPKAAIGKTGYKAIRFHDTIGEITTTPNADGEYIEVKGNELILHVKLLSDFAVVYNDTDATPDVPDPDPVPKPDPDPTPVKPDPTPVKPNPVKPSSDTGTKAAKATTSTKKSSKTSSPKTADYAVNSLLALLTGAAGLFGITLINKKRKEDEE
ncbi:hypothetical protein [Lachnobacterium bovis]|uniref:LPXTG-motif cell wall anchor domain-containing protein n=1 Tax=Lachnobacterium bovis DSM 14045 TaxID=1122142 RepID=A0A1H3HUI3_9FIRM|nr:hypothetical protein [Lachnobacterium bovis]SDY19171.1 hypothetical protein SAMN02910414_00959 [Lachnobacterium bovis DSM 14045]